MGIQKKVLIAILISGFIALSAGLLITDYQVRKVLVEAIGRDFAEIAKKAAERFDATVKGEITALKRLAADSEFIAAVKENRKQAVQEYLRSYLRFAEEKGDHFDLIVVNRTGGMITHMSRGGDYKSDQSDESWWKATYANGKGKIYASTIYLESMQGTRAFDIGIPILDPVTGMVIGGVRSVINVDLFFNFINEMNFGKSGHGMLVDSNGTPLICAILPLREHLIKPSLINQITTPDSGWVIAKDDAHGGRNSIIGFSPVKFMNSLGPENLGSYTWYTFVRQNPKETFAPVNRLILKLFVFESAMVVMISVLGFFIFNKLLIKPVSLLHEGVDRIGKGEFEHKVDIHTGDELEVLARGFNRMGATLKESYDNLERRIQERTTELEKTKGYLESILKYSNDMIITTDLEGSIVTFNEGAERILGYKSIEVVGTLMVDYYYQKEERSKLYEIIEHGAMVNNYDTQLVRKDGKVIDISLSLSLLRDENEKVVGTVGIGRDITEWKKMQEQLNEYSHRLESMVEKRTLELDTSKSHFEAMLSGIADGIIFADQQNKITFMNNAAEEIFNMKREACLGRDFKDCHSSVSHDKALQLIQDMRDGKIKSYAVELQAGEKAVFAHFSSIMHGSEYMGIIFIARDVTERKRLREELVRSEKLALVGKMSATIAHELRNPLAPIGGFARLIHKKLENESPLKKYAELIVKEIDRLEELLHEYLDFTKEVKPVRQSVNMEQLIDELLVFYKDTLAVNNIQVHTRFSSETVTVSIDTALIKQALINIFNNAIQAMPDGGTLTIESNTKEKGGKLYVSVSVRDTGAGIPDGVKKNIFDPFYTTKVHGLGLGLPVARGIVESHGGEIEVKSIKGIGTTFTINLPT